MTVMIAHGDPKQAEHLLLASHALMQSLFPAESNHYLSLSELRTPDIHFLIATHDGTVKGCVACKDYANYGEVKSLFVDPAARGLGIGEQLLTRLIHDATTRGLPLLRLETGNSLHTSHRLYHRMGFINRGPFGEYPDDPLSLFMERAL